MVTRLLIEVVEFGSVTDRRWQELCDHLKQMGAQNINPPQTELPNIATASFADDSEAEGVLRRLNENDYVVRAERDTWSEAY